MPVLLSVYTCPRTVTVIVPGAGYAETCKSGSGGGSAETAGASQYGAAGSTSHTKGVPQAVPAGTGIEYLANQKCTDTKVLGIVASGYPHVPLDKLGLNSKYEAYYATKMALWCHLLSNWSVYDLKVNPGCSDQAAAQRVLKAAKEIYQTGMYWTKPLTPKLTATPDQPNSYPVTIDGKGYMQQVYQVVSETWVDGGWVHVKFTDSSSAPTGTRIIDKDGNDCTQISCMESTGNGFAGQFTILIPQESMDEGDGSVQVEVSGVGHNYAIFYATCAETDKYGNLQKYMADTDPRHPIKVDVIANYSKNPPPPDDPPPENPPPEITPPGDLLIIKRDAGTLDLLDGAIFEVVGPNGDTIGSFSSVGGEVSVPNLEPGNYTVYERVPPRNYLLSDEPARNVTVKTGETATLTYDNEPFGSLRIEKVSDTGDKLPDVTIQIKHIESGRTYSGKTEDTGAIEFTELKPGAYEVREIAGIKGWQLDPDSVKTVTVVTGETSTVTFVNKELPGLRIIKYDSSSKEVLSGVTFEIWRDGESLGSFETGELGEILLTDLTPGTYLVQEKFVDDGHVIDSTPQQVELRAGDGIKQLVFYNDKKPGMKLVKVDASDPSKVIPNAKFEIKSVDGSFGPEEYITDEHGEIDLSKLPLGAYVVTEISCPGYIIDEAQRIIQLDGNETAKFVFTNHIKPSLRLIKKSSDGSPLSGVHFRIAKIKDGTRYLDRITNDQGEILISDLEPGVYSVKETATTSNHIIDIREYHVELFPGKTSEIAIENQKRPNLIVYKHDADTGEPIANTVFTVRAADGHSVDEIKTDANGKAELKNLLPGVYEISEKSVPSPWLKDAPAQLVTLYPNRDHTVYFKNHKRPVIEIIKENAVTFERQANVPFQVWYASNNTSTGELNDLGTFYTDENGRIELNGPEMGELGLRDGWFRVKELEPLKGFAIADPDTQEAFVAAGQGHTFVFRNRPLSAICVWKYDSVNPNLAIEGAVFQIRYLSGNTSGTGGTVIGTFRTSANGSFTATGLQRGTYIIEELSSDGNHVIDTPPQTVYLSGEDQEVIQVYFGNSPKGSLLVKKVSGSNNAPLSDVEFFVTTADGTVVGDANGKFVTDGAGTFLVDNVDPNTTLVVKESRSKPGYLLDDTPQTAQIKAGQTVTLEFRNQPLGSLMIHKYSSLDRKTPLAGVQFKVTYAPGCVVDDENGKVSSNGIYYTGPDGTITINGIVGTVVITEQATIPGYTIDPNTRSQTIVVNPDDVQHAYFYNTPKNTLIIEKYIEEEGSENKPLKGVTFLVTDSSGAVVGNSNGEYISGEDGRVVIPGLEPGSTITAREVKVPDGVVLDGTPKTIKISDDGANILRFYNKKTGYLVIRKLDKISKQPLANVEFELTYADGSFVDDNFGHLSSKGRFKTNDAGEIRVPVVGTVVAKELTPCPGYVIDESTRIQTITVNPADTQTITVYNEPLCTLTISKRDAVSGKPVPNTEFTLRDGDGNLIGRYTTGADGTVTVTGLIPNSTVVVVETRVPSSYVLDPTPRTIIVRNGSGNSVVTGGNGTIGGGSSSGNGNGSGNHVDVENIPKTTLTIEKYLETETGNVPLKGVTFLVTDSSGAVVGGSNGEYITGEDGRIVIPNLEPGITVTAKELKVPDGVVLDATPKSIEIKGGEGGQTLRFVNKPTGYLVIKKLNKLTSEPLAGVEFKLSCASGEFVDDAYGHLSSLGLYTTDQSGEIRVPVVGTIVVEETRSLPGFTIDPGTKRQVVTVNPADTQTLTVYNTPGTTLTIQKLVTGTTDKPLAGVEFLITDSSGAYVGPNKGIYKTDEYGRIVLSDLKPGTVITAKETATVDGFVLDGTPKSIEIEAGEGQTLTFYNAPVGGLELIKVNEADKTQRIPNTTFEIRKMDGALVDTVTTDKQGRAHLDLDAGDFYAVETEAGEGFKLDATPTYFTIQDGKATTVTITNKAFSGILIHKTDSVTGKGIYGVTFLLYDSGHKPVGQYTSDNSGYVYIEGLTTSGRYYLRELENKGYVPDTQLKTVYVTAGETTLVEWKNIPITAQIQIVKKSADYNSTNGLPAGTLLEGAVFEIYDKAGNLVDTIKSDKRGLATSKPLPLSRYTIKEVKAPANYGVSDTGLTAYLEHEGQILRFEVTNKSLATGVSITKSGPREAMAGQPVNYVLSGIANNSNVRLDNFYWRDTLPAQVRLNTIVTGTYNFPGVYKITYRVNGGEYRTLADNLSTQKNYTLQASPAALGLAANERVTEVMFVFGQAPAGFAQVEKPQIRCTAVAGLTAGSSFVNIADVGGVYNGVWVQAISRWVTAVYGKPTPLPKTGY